MSTLTNAYNAFNSMLDPYSSIIGGETADNASAVAGFSNRFTGNLDYKRSLETQNIANAFTAQQAQLDREFNAEEARKTRDYNATEAQKQRDFEEMMSNTAYSRAIADARKNGINPYAILGAASTPSGVAASANSAAHSGGHGSVGQHFNSGLGYDTYFRMLGNIVGSAFSLAMKGLSGAASQPRMTQYFSRFGELRGTTITT